MATRKLVLLPVLLFLAVLTASASKQQLTERRVSEAQQCRFQRLRSIQPDQRIESEGGFSELWSQNEEQFQCAGVSAMRNVIRPQSMYVPAFQPTPRLVFIERGIGLIGLHLPGCAETFHAESERGSSKWWKPWGRRGEQGRGEQDPWSGQGEHGQEERGQGQGREQISMKDQHQKVFRVRQGDIVALPPGITHWCYNDGNEEFVAISIDDLNHQANQLDLSFRQFHLAGGVPRQEIRGGQGQGRFNFQNILSGFDSRLLAQAFGVSPDLLERMQQETQRGFIVKTEEMSMIRPQEEQEERFERGSEGGRKWWSRDNDDNGLEETMCSVKIRYNLDRSGEAEVFSKQAGRINSVNQNKLPILQYLDMSAERGHLYPNALFTPHWSSNEHTVIYVTQGDARIQVVDQQGETVFDDKVNEGDLFVIPQFFVSMGQAGSNGFKYTAFKTSSQQFKHPLAGYTSVLNAMPIQVLANSFQISPADARNLKQSLHGETFLMSPSSRPH
uniref:Cupin type-1 domain-containing protein n=1 Tax=Kalanchoe fedtschenkoi TaxID=63787 RepID=A0A7N0UXB5_KALFE